MENNDAVKPIGGGWSQFDKIFVISLAESVDRREHLKKELKRVGIDEKGDNFEWKITVRNPLYKRIWQNPTFKREWIDPNRWFNCTLAHYECFMEADALGYDRILIMEDDVVFLKDVEKLMKILNNVPDYDICLFDKWTHWNENYRERAELRKVNGYYFSYTDWYFWSAACYGLSRKAFKKLLEYQNKDFHSTDHYTNNRGAFPPYPVIADDDLIRISPLENIAIQDPSFKADPYSRTDPYILVYDNIADFSDYNLKLKDIKNVK